MAGWLLNDGLLDNVVGWGDSAAAKGACPCVVVWLLSMGALGCGTSGAATQCAALPRHLGGNRHIYSEAQRQQLVRAFPSLFVIL